MRFLFKLNLAVLPAFFLFAACSSHKKATTQESKIRKRPSSLEYEFVRSTKGKRKPVKGDYVEVHVISKIGDSTIFNSSTANSGFPMQLRIPYNDGTNDLVGGIRLMCVGDSAIFKLPVDSLIASGGQVQPWMKQGTNQVINYYVSLVSIKNAVEILNEEEEETRIRKDKDDAQIAQYLRSNKIAAKKTKSGLYISILEPGIGKMPAAGQKVLVNYTGTTLAGEVFDSNTDESFNHRKPLSFKYAMGEVIQGWDEGIGYLRPGGKAKLFIPSDLAYGSRKSGRIKPYSILVFDVELLAIE